MQNYMFSKLAFFLFAVTLSITEAGQEGGAPAGWSSFYASCPMAVSSPKPDIEMGNSAIPRLVATAQSISDGSAANEAAQHTQGHKSVPGMAIWFQGLHGSGTRAVEMGSDATVSDLHESIAAATGIHANSFELQYLGRPLDDDSTLGDAGIGAETMVDIHDYPSRNDLSMLNNPSVKPTITRIREFLEGFGDQDAFVYLRQSQVYILKEGRRPRFSWAPCQETGYGRHTIMESYRGPDGDFIVPTNTRKDDHEGKWKARKVDFGLGEDDVVISMNPGVPLRDVFDLICEL